MSLRSLDPTKGYAAPKARKDMSPDEINYLDVTVPQREEAMRRSRAKSARSIALDLVYQAQSEGDVTAEAIAKRYKWPIEKARFLLTGGKS